MLAGTLARGDRLPSSRALAADLGVSRAVTAQAYEQLVAEGWLETRHGAGTFVASDGGPARRAGRRAAPPPAPRWSGSTRARRGSTRGTRPGWRRAWREVSTARPPRGYDDPRGLPELRAALADHLARTRGLAVTPTSSSSPPAPPTGCATCCAVLPPGPVAARGPGLPGRGRDRPRVGRTVRRPAGDRAGHRPAPASSRPTSPPRTSTRSAG